MYIFSVFAGDTSHLLLRVMYLWIFILTRPQSFRIFFSCFWFDVCMFVYFCRGMTVREGENTLEKYIFLKIFRKQLHVKSLLQLFIVKMSLEKSFYLCHFVTYLISIICTEPFRFLYFLFKLTSLFLNIKLVISSKGRDLLSYFS